MKFPLHSLYGFYRNAIRNPKYRWWLILGTLVYFLSPIDISPDVIPFVGEIDDVLLMTLMLTEVSQMLIEKVRQRQQPEVESDATPETAQTVVDVDAA